MTPSQRSHGLQFEHGTVANREQMFKLQDQADWTITDQLSLAHLSFQSCKCSGPFSEISTLESCRFLDNWSFRRKNPLPQRFHFHATLFQTPRKKNSSQDQKQLSLLSFFSHRSSAKAKIKIAPRGRRQEARERRTARQGLYNPVKGNKLSKSQTTDARWRPN